MKVLLQDCKSLLYFGHDNEWTPQISGARPFDSSQQALQTARTEGLELFQIVLKFDEDRYDVHLSKSAGC